MTTSHFKFENNAVYKVNGIRRPFVKMTGKKKKKKKNVRAYNTNPTEQTIESDEY